MNNKKQKNQELSFRKKRKEREAEEEEEEKGCVNRETMQSSLRKPNDVGPSSLSNLRTNEIPHRRGEVAYVKELSYKMATCLQSYRKYNNTL